ncbi:hypothetical protein B0A58_07460 [Flavobacterium branchiophilum NBRC 15030 = ATCC 35035]|uniref:LysM domain-containing protein n=1 Tax=Flavobacterium branchiophilum TaxID=55197 RepID=A0A543G175_9FLAO|nr:hypothetical protein [Flavobacterium branchiophilum]OXA76401.1 hypothetical protein B0A58_07460 [Flavobacterium branchiophilum NBRC 15030 = ATCC 35035]TQM39774.1 hypothetical protein BC670_0605 [Flavobacterium branchiophilum]GEM55235.1 hypothetical protein FB1_14560 [Flavobacterium branchiophilum NBRC 15030 = ATCC 35035]
MTDYKVYENQTLLDVSSHVYGRADVAIDLAILNNIALHEHLRPGQVIKMINVPIRTLVIRAIESRKIIPSTGHKTENDVDNLGFPNEFVIQF